MDRELKMRLEAGLGDMAPKLAEKILEQPLVPIESEAELFAEKPKIRTMPPGRGRTRGRVYRAAAGLAAMFALLFCFHEVRDSNTIEGMIIVDVNPSVSLSVNKNGKVRRVDALNEDGTAIVDGLNKKKGSVDAVLGSVFDSLETQEYLKSEKAGVLVSYCYEQESADVETKIQSAIVNLSGSRQNCTIFSQTFAKEEEEEEKAKTAGVSVGKYYFVNRIKESSEVSEEVSYDKTIEEIVQLMDDQGVEVVGVEVYIGGDGGASGGGTEIPATENTEQIVQTTEVENGANSASSENTENATQGTEDTQVPGTEETTQSTETAESPGGAGTEAGPTEAVESGTESNSQPPATEQPPAESNSEPSTAAPDVSNLKLSWVVADFEEDQKVYIEWNSLKAASGYDIYYRSTTGSKFEKLAEGVTGTTCVVSGLTPGRSYIFKVVPYIQVNGIKYYGKGLSSISVDIPVEEMPPLPDTEWQTETGETQAGETEDTAGQAGETTEE
ncbi:MAG: fibronectin type III domain-containing protein [Roseburia sp.]|nr:fibronectin type III domain-containing protein [Roseburia sp.]MCM1430084.1 fibronectin type III domain-containing protein [Muribaculaceae bacterium]